MIYESIVIGGGQAGLAAAYHLKQSGINFVILESSDAATGSWSNYYESLKLFSPARYSSLPGMPFPGHPDQYPSRNEVIDYLKNYASHFQFPVHTDQKVLRVNKNNEGIFEITTSQDQTYFSKTVICATGSFHSPYIPNIPGIEKFQGSIIHSNAYKNVQNFSDQNIIVVGAGNSAVQIAVELAEVSNVVIATRNPIKFMAQTFLGKDLHFWLSITGLDTAFFGKWLLGSTSSGVLDTGRYHDAVENHRPAQKAMFLKFTEQGVVWQDGTHQKVDAVIFATGYIPNFDYLQLHDSDPIHDKGISQSVPGLFFLGLSWQRSFDSATIRGVGDDAKFVVKRIKRLIRSSY